MAGFGRLADDQRQAYLYFAEKLLEGVDLTATLVSLILSPDLRTSSSELVREVASWIHATTADALALELRAYADGEDLLPKLRSVEVPCLTLVGELDHNQPPTRSQEIAEAMPRGKLEVIPGVGHALLLEDLSSTVAAVRAFLERLPGAAASTERRVS